MQSDLGGKPFYRPRPGDRVIRIPRLKPWRIAIPLVPKKAVPKASLWTLPYGFAILIAVGTVLLTLPFASKSGQVTSFIDALFTATSAVCVTGLVVVDTLDYWSYFGQGVILLLIQLGGFGFMTITTLFLLALGRRIGLRERMLLGEAAGLSHIGGVVKLIRKLVIFTLGAEIIGAVVFFQRFSEDSTWGVALWKSVFQSVSAFNNAGFDLFGSFASVAAYQDSLLILLTTAALVFLGGISFLVVLDIFRTRRPHFFSVDTKIILSLTVLLLASGMLVVLVAEYTNPGTLGAMPVSGKILNSFFQSVTSRTAGFSSFAPGSMTEYALFFTMILMFIGGASGSTAGGIKVGTFGLIISTIWSTIKGREHPSAFGREFPVPQIFRALAVLVISLGIIAVLVFVLTITEPFGFLELLFEGVSAFGTVGLSTGITPELSVGGRLVIIIAMFIGRLGPLTLTLALTGARRMTTYRYPKEFLRVG